MTEEGESFISRCLDKNCLLVYKLLTHFTIFASLGNHSCKSNGPDFDLGDSQDQDHRDQQVGLVIKTET